MRKIDEVIKKKIKQIKLVIFDVDGVLTDGRIAYLSSGEEIKFFNVKDGYGIYLLNKTEIKTALITAGNEKIIKKRAKDMKVPYVYCTRYKMKAYEEIKTKLKLSDKNISYIGDDFLDYECMKKCGFPATVLDAPCEIKKISDYVASKEGGKGGAREIVELILKTKNVWKKVISI